ncbi:MAG: 50S ribosome-binding GTPase [Phycisphaerales bacterium]|jgi:tRNA modification GTPase
MELQHKSCTPNPVRYDVSDTIVAVSSPTPDKRVIIRITGPGAMETCTKIFKLPDSLCVNRHGNALTTASLKIDDGLEIEAQLYLFFAPHSYTGDDLVEIHVCTNTAVAEALINRLLGGGIKPAGPGEFTARAYLNGKIDLAQAEAVNEIIVSSNEFQLAAAEKLLSGRLNGTIAEIRTAMMECLSLLEAGLDFSGEDIEFKAGAEIAERLIGIKHQLERLLSGSIRYESLMELPAVGIAGATNAGKSSLLNKLLEKERSIVSGERHTTRDVLSVPLKLEHCECVLFDCAGLVLETDNILDELAHQAAIEALGNSSIVLFCVDVSKADWSEDLSIRELIEPKVFVPVTTKCDLVFEEVLPNRLAELEELFGAGLLVTSAKSGEGLELLLKTIDEKIINAGYGKLDNRRIVHEGGVALVARHKRAVSEAIENVGESAEELKAGNDEVAAMMLRAAYEAVSSIGRPISGQIDEQILEQIFSRFCIGK